MTTIPIVRAPFHVSYLLYLLAVSKGLALTYLRTALLLCRLTRTAPSVLLHPLDFLGKEDAPGWSSSTRHGHPREAENGPSWRRSWRS